MSLKRSLLILLLFVAEYGWCNMTYCPFNEQCRCFKGSTYEVYSDITCNSVPFSKFPGFPEVRIEKLEIKESGIESLEDDSFGDLTAYSLVLDNNHIISIANNTFRKMTRTLKELSLNNNNLNEIPIKALDSLETLKTLKLNRNQISSVVTSWGGLKETLNYFELSNNDIDSMPLNPESSLTNFKHLNHIYLSGNLLLTLEANAFPYSLKELNASNNYVKDFPHDLLNILQDLTELDLSENAIEVLTDHKYEGKINLDRLDLSYNHLKAIKTPFGKGIKINRLILSRNNITGIEKESFSGLDIKEIDLSANKLHKLDDSSFKGTEGTLEHLDLSHNKFSKVPDGLKELKNLKSFSLAYNNLAKVKNSLYYFSGLRKLSLAGNILGIFPVEALGPLRSLTSLDLSYNKIADIRKSDFKTWGRNLEKLSLQSNSLFFLGDSTFEYTSKLTDLSLSYNTISDVSISAFKNLDQIERVNISCSLKGYGFPEPLLAMKTLSYLALDNNNINSISKDITKLERIKTLILDFNRIKDIELSTFDSKAHKYLTDLRISFNFINKIDSNTFSELNSLQYLSLHNNKIIKLAEFSFINLPQNISIYLSANKIDDISKHAFSSIPKLKKLDLHNNNLQLFDYNIFQNVTSASGPMSLNLSRNRIETIKVPDYQRVPVYIEVLDLDHNKITKVPEKLVEIQTSLKRLSLSYNEITSIETQDFYDMVTLERLRLVHNKITKIKDNSFVSLKKLQIFNISHNHIEEIAAGLFKNLEKLRILDLSYNNIGSIAQSAFDNTKLEHLYLSNNKISSLTYSTFLNIGKTLKILDLSHNQILAFANNFFQYASNIQRLNLCYNNLSSDTLSAFPNSSLIHLELCGNYLINIPSNAFGNSTTLISLNLASTGLQSFPNLTLTNLVDLNISDNKIKNLSTSFFAGMPKLKILNLKKNNISALNNINWIQAPNLRELDLSYNPIKILDKPCFFGLYNLRKLNIQHLDQIDQLDSGIFMDLDKLTSLKIDFQKRVGLNLNQTLGHLKYLKEFSLLVKDSSFSYELPHELPRKMRILEITGETLNHIDSDTLKSLRYFHNFKLQIRGTGISHFPKHFFNIFKGKGFTLDLSNNKLERIGPESLYNTYGDMRRYGSKAFTGGLGVEGNKLECGCDVKWLAEWLRRYLVETLGVNQMSVEERLAIIENMNDLSCFDKKTQQKFPILTYDLISDEKLCGIVLNVPKVVKASADKADGLGILVAFVLILDCVAVRWWFS